MRKFTFLFLFLYLTGFSPLNSQELGLPENINSASKDIDKLACIVPTNEKDKSIQNRIKELVVRFKEAVNDSALIMTDRDALMKNLTDYSIFAFGSNKGNKWISEHMALIPVVVADNHIEGSKIYKGRNLRLITVWRNPLNHDKPVIIFTAQQAQDVLKIFTAPFGTSQYVIARDKEILEQGYYLKNGDTRTCYLPSEHKFPLHQVKEDVEYMLDTMERVHPDLYAYIPRHEIMRRKRELFAAIEKPISRHEFCLWFIPLVTSLKDGHTSLDMPKEEFYNYTKRGGKVFPFPVLIKEDRIYISDNTFCQEIPVYSEILRIQNISSSEILKKMRSYASGWRTEFRNRLAEESFPILYWFFYGDKDEFYIRYRSLRNSVIQKTSVPGITYDEYSRSFRLGTEQTEPYSYRETDNKVGIIEIQLFKNYSAFQAFLKETFSLIRENGVMDLIIDIRSNMGGDSRLGDELFRYITDQPFRQARKIEIKVSREINERGILKKSEVEGGRKIVVRMPKLRKPENNEFLFRGTVYLLTGAKTFSSAVLFASAFTCFNMGKIVGQETGGLTVSYGDKYNLVLPNTRLNAGVAFKKLFAACGKEDFHGVIPDYLIEPAGLQREDAVLEFTIDLIKKTGNQKK